MKSTPPSVVLKFLRWFCREDFIEEIEGDLTEIFEKQVTESPRKAKLKFTWSVLKYFRPEFIKSFRHTTNHVDMLRHNLLITYRNFLRYKSSFLINLFGLSTGLSCALLIYLWVTDELSIDKFHEKDEQLYQVMINYHFPDGIKTWEATPTPLADALSAEMPEVDYAVSVNKFTDWFKGPGMIARDDKSVIAKGIFASRNFFNVFSYPLILGDKGRVLADKNGIVISKSLALKLFKTTANVVGQTLEWNHKMRLKGPFYISGIFQDPPANATTQFDVVFNYGKLLEGDENSSAWNSSYAETYLILKKGVDIAALNQKIAGYLPVKYTGVKTDLFITRYSDKYLFGHYENGLPAGGRINYVLLFSAIALFTLAVACINFMNLSTAQASRKMKEVGVKKAMGINRRALVVQFFSESILIALLSVVIAIPVVILLLPQFSALTGKQLEFNLSVNAALSVGVIVLLTGIIAGCYPALYLSAFNPVMVLKGTLSITFEERWVRKVLTVVQFTISLVFITGFFVVHQQMEFTQSRNLGYDKEHVISFQRRGVFDFNDYEIFIDELKQIPGVVSASCMFGSILDKEMAHHSGFSWDGQPENNKDLPFPSPTISHGLLETLAFDIVEGRSFSSAYSSEESKVIINETAAKVMGFQHPVGKVIRYGTKEMEIIGMVRDFQFGSLHNRIEPVIFMYAARRSDILVRIQPGTERVTLQRMEDVYKKFHTGFAFDFTFLADDYLALYESDRKVAVLSRYFAIVAIIISCLGLVGLAAFTAQRRQKEIGVRKVLGATALGIVGLLSADFTKTILVAIAIALPISYFTSQQWLETFAYRVTLTVGPFAGAGAITLLVAWMTVGFQTLKAARVNPAECLRSE